MSLKTKAKIFSTLKFRIAALYALLFTISSALIFLAVYYFLHVELTGRLDSKLLAFSRRIGDIYLKGEAYEYNEEDPVTNALPEIPPKILSIACRNVPGLEIKKKELIVRENKTVYEIIGVAGDFVYEIQIDKSGNVIEIEKHEKSNTKFIEMVFADESKYEGIKKIFFLLRSPDGKILANSDISLLRHGDNGEPVKHGIFEGFGEAAVFKTVTYAREGRQIRICQRVLHDENILEVGVRLRDEVRLLKDYSSVFLLVFIVSLFPAVITGWLVAAGSMGGIDRICEAAARVGKGNFNERVQHRKNEGEEIKILVDAFNEMISKIQLLVSNLESVTDNIAHDMRTPLTRIRGIVETTVNGKPNLSDYHKMAGDIVEECDNLIGMMNTMLEISRADARLLPLDETEIDIKNLLRGAFDLFLPVAEQKNIEFKLSMPSEASVKTRGNIPYLQRTLANLLDNALKYTANGGNVELGLLVGTDMVEISVKDTGCGIATADLDHIFDRFYRADTSRSTPGNGLGLSLARAIVNAHKGRLSVESIPEKGSLFTIKLPRSF
jgi:signal transduction histidine kinase